MLKKDMANGDPRYKDLVSIDKYAEYEINHKLFGHSISERKRRDTREQEHPSGSAHGVKKTKYYANRNEKEDIIMSSKSQVLPPRYAARERHRKRVDHAILRRLNPEVRDTVSDMLKRRRLVMKKRKLRKMVIASNNESNIYAANITRSETMGVAKTSGIEVHDNTVPVAADNELENELLQPVKLVSSGKVAMPNARHETSGVQRNNRGSSDVLTKSRVKRETDEYDTESSGDGEGDYDWDNWYNEDDYEEWDDEESYDENEDWWQGEEEEEDWWEGEDEADNDWGEFEFEDYGFAGKVQTDYEFKQFMKASKTQDYSDLIDVLKPTKEDLDAYGHQGSDFILQCSFDKTNCSYL